MPTYSKEKQKEIFARAQRKRRLYNNPAHKKSMARKRWEHYRDFRRKGFMMYLDYNPDAKERWLKEQESKKEVKREKERIRRNRQKAKNREKYEKFKKQYLSDPELRKKVLERHRRYYFFNKYELNRKERLKTIEKHRKQFQKLNAENPNESYKKTLAKILALDCTTPQERQNVKNAFFGAVYQMEKQDRKVKEKIDQQKLEAEKLGITYEEYKKRLEKELAEKQKKEKMKKLIREFFSDEQVLIETRLQKLQDKLPTYSPIAPKEKEIIKKEIKQQMSKISFDHGKTFLNPNDSTDFNIILGKISRIKTWQAVVERFDPDTMMEVLESMPANERKQVSTNNNATNRALYLCKYLLRAENDLIL